MATEELPRYPGRVKYILFLFLVCLPGCFGGVWQSSWRGSVHLQEAEEETRKGNFDKAVAAYEAHIARRLAVTNRPAWENPQFYLLAIGDLQLRKGDRAAALTAYEKAEEAGVDKALVADRYRYVGSWHESRGELKEAQEVLLKYRDRDPLLFNAMLDRLARSIVEQEELELSEATTTPTPTPSLDR